jgi:hypothetical protein
LFNEKGVNSYFSFQEPPFTFPITAFLSFPSFAMKNFLMLALVAFATIEANAQTSQPSAPMTKAERKAARQAKQPQVYKGSVAERRRMVTDAAGAESDRDGDDDATTTKSSKKSKSKN